MSLSLPYCIVDGEGYFKSILEEKENENENENEDEDEQFRDIGQRAG